MKKFLISWINKNRGFDKSIGEYKTPDLFTFLENIYEFDYKSEKFYDDIYYILTYVEKSASFLFENLNSNIKRKNELTHISRAKTFDTNSLLWLGRQEGRTLKEKVKNNKIKALQKYYDYDTYENRLFKLFLKKILKKVELRDDLSEFEEFIFKIRRFLRSEKAEYINENRNIVYNNLLLHHKHYYKIYKSYKWLNSINQKESFFNENSQKILDKIFRFDILCRIQYNTFSKVLPKNLLWERFWDINLNDFLLNKKIEHLFYKKDFRKIDVNSLAFIKKYMHLSIVNRYFNIKQDAKNVFVDMFRLFPIARINDENITFPVFVKQLDKRSVINANNTKIIDLNREFYTLPEILKTYNLDILTLFLEDFKKYFKNVQINYILPDYIDTFKFSKAKKLINSYFHGRKIPKSVLAGLSYIFKNKVARNDILIYIQKNHENELFVTPLLIDFDKKLLLVTNGLFIKRYPTKKIKKSNDIINYLKNLFDKKTAQKILNKFLQNGIKGLNKTKTALLYNNKLYYFSNLDFINPSSVNEDEVKNFYDINIFENKNYKEIKDDKFENLKVFEKNLKYEQKGYILWREYIPKLSLEVLNNYGVYEEFVLVDKNSKMEDETIVIDKHFIIPKNMKSIALPLKFEDTLISFEAYISSNEMPFREDVECELKLIYNYELENPYNLIFYPLNKNYKPLKVKWKEKKEKKLPFPLYPSKKVWEDFLNDNGSNLPEWILERLELLELKVPMYKVKNETKEVLEDIKESYIVSNIMRDKKNHKFFFVKGNERDINCNETQFIENIDINTLKRGDRVKFYVPKNSNFAKYIHINNINLKPIIEDDIYKKHLYFHSKMNFKEKTEDIAKSLYTIRVPVLKMWSNMSLNDEFVPKDFKEKIDYYKRMAFDIMLNKECDESLKKELQFFLSAIHEDTLPQFYEYMLNLSSKGILYENMALLIKGMNHKWQKELFFNIIKQISNPLVLKLLAIAVWRDEKFVFFLKDYIDEILVSLLDNLKKSFDKLKEFPSKKSKKILTSNLELLFALIRLREKSPDFLNPNEDITKEFLKILNDITMFIVTNNIELISKIELSLKNDSNNKIPDFLYALNIYLRGDLNMAKSIKITGVGND